MNASYRIDRAAAHLDNFEGQLRGMPDDIDPAELDKLADRIERAHKEVLHAIAYSRVCRARKAEAEANVDAVIEDTRRAA